MFAPAIVLLYEISWYIAPHHSGTRLYDEIDYNKIQLYVNPGLWNIIFMCHIYTKQWCKNYTSYIARKELTHSALKNKFFLCIIYNFLCANKYIFVTIAPKNIIRSAPTCTGLSLVRQISARIRLAK